MSSDLLLIVHFQSCSSSGARLDPSTDDEFIWFHSCRLLASPFVAGVVRVNHPKIQFGNPAGYVNKRSPKMADRARMIYRKAERSPLSIAGVSSSLG